MKIFIQSDNIVACIAGEMINMEAGKFLYDLGSLRESVERSSGYPVYKTDTNTTFLECTYGIVFLPGYKVSHEFVDEIVNKLKFYSADYLAKHGISHLDKYISLETGADHFTTPRIKRNDVDRDITIAYKISDIFSTAITNHKFRWFFLPINSILDTDFRFEGDGQLQIYSIMYDKNNIFEIANNTLTDKYLCRATTKYSKYHKDMTYLGIADDVYKKYRSGEKKYHNMEHFIIGYRRHMKNMDILPGDYMRIKVCNIRWCDMNIIRYFGKWSLYTGASSPFVEITRDIYEISYDSVIINNKMSGMHPPDDDCCCVCETPLYDYFYLAEISQHNGYAVCGICAHTGFIKVEDGNLYSSSKGVINFTRNKNVKRLFKIKHQRTLEDMLAKIDCEIVKEIIISARKSFQIEWFRELKLIHIQGYNHKFICYCGNSYLLFRKYFKKNYDKLESNTIVLPIDMFIST